MVVTCQFKFKLQFVKKKNFLKIIRFSKDFFIIAIVFVKSSMSHFIAVSHHRHREYIQIVYFVKFRKIHFKRDCPSTYNKFRSWYTFCHKKRCGFILWLSRKIVIFWIYAKWKYLQKRHLGSFVILLWLLDVMCRIKYSKRHIIYNIYIYRYS